MARLEQAYAALDDYRAALTDARRHEGASPADRFSARGAFSAFSTPLSNVHAVGIGLRLRKGRPVPGDFVLKVFVFDKQDLGAGGPAITRGEFQGVGIDIEAMPVQRPIAARQAAGLRKAPKDVRTTPEQHQARHRPVVGGIQISPSGANFVGTLGCLVRDASGRLFALSNNHVMADTNRLAIGTPIVQPSGNAAGDVIAQLSGFEPIRFPGLAAPTPRNRLDVALASITDTALVQAGRMFGIPNYTPTLQAPRPGMAVTKSGRTTAVTRGTITAIRVDGVMVDYGTPGNPMIATFDGCTRVAGGAFSGPGDSGSVILEQSSGRPVALLFAGDSGATLACDLIAACDRFGVVPA